MLSHLKFDEIFSGLFYGLFLISYVDLFKTSYVSNRDEKQIFSRIEYSFPNSYFVKTIFKIQKPLPLLKILFKIRKNSNEPSPSFLVLYFVTIICRTYTTYTVILGPISEETQLIKETRKILAASYIFDYSKDRAMGSSINHVVIFLTSLPLWGHFY